MLAVDVLASYFSAAIPPPLLLKLPLMVQFMIFVKPFVVFLLLWPKPKLRVSS